MEAIPDPKSINTALAYVVDGRSYRGLLETATAVRNMIGLQGIQVTHSDGRIAIGMGGAQDPNATNGVALTWSVIPLNVCNGNNVTTIYVLAGVQVA